MKPYAYVGAYWPDRDFTLAQRVGNLTVVNQSILAQPERMAALRESGLNIILNLSYLSQDLLTDPESAPEWPSHHHIYAGFYEAGLLDRILAILIHDEPFLGLVGGRFATWPALRGGVDPTSPDVKEAFARGLSTYAAALKRLFPGRYVGSTDSGWTRWDRRHEGWYAPLPEAFDFVGVDAYVPSPWDRDRAERIISRAYAETSRCGRPILAVPHAFRDESDLWRDMPTVGDLVQQLEILARFPAVVGVCWFCLDHPNARNGAAGLAQHPGHLAATEWYAAWCRDARRVAA